jgi:membrane protease YdiL (CAAX protease family)
VLGTVLLAAFLWFVTFYVPWGIFWFKISFSAATLAWISLWLTPREKVHFRMDAKSILIGLTSAVALYGIFWVGKVVSSAVFSFAPNQIAAIYSKGEGTPLWIISLLLFFITGPSEEIYWRGYLQRNLMGRFGNWQGWILASIVYAGVHIWSFNFMLIGAAGVAGAFWGALYWRLENLAPVIISHSIWSTVIFALFAIS